MEKRLKTDMSIQIIIKKTILKEKILENNISEDRIEMLEKTIEKCKINNVELYFVTSPKLLNTNYKNTTQYQKLVQIIDESDFYYSDYYDADIFISDSTLFKDNTHLNGNGAKVFSSLIFQQIKSNAVTLFE